MDPIVIYVDGGCKGNGGSDPQGYASIAVYYKGEKKAYQHWQLTSADTNNKAEYGALLIAFEYLKSLAYKMDDKPLPAVVIKSDSQLVIEQLAGKFKVKKAELKPLYEAAKTWLKANPSISLEKVDRSEIVAILGH